MSRYDAADNTLAAEVDAIDVVGMSQSIIAYAGAGSAFAEGVPTTMGDRKGLLGRGAEVTFTDQDLDTAVATPPDNQAFAPTARTYECTGKVADVVISQSALADGRTSGRSVQDMVLVAGGNGYIKKFDAMCAATYLEATASTHEIGSSGDAVTASLINQALRIIFSSGGKGRAFGVFGSSKYEEVMAIPGMQEKAIVGGRAGGIDLGPLSPDSPVVIRGWGGKLDIAFSDEIVSSSGLHNMIWSAGPDTPGLINKWHPLEDLGGSQPGKMMLDMEWNSKSRAIEMNFTTQEVVQGYAGSATANPWMVDVISAV